MLPAGVRHRQLRARTLPTGMMLAPDDRRPACLTEIRAALTSLPEADQARPGVLGDWHGRPRQLTCRQAEHASRLIARTLAQVRMTSDQAARPLANRAGAKNDKPGPRGAGRVLTPAYRPGGGVAVGYQAAGRRWLPAGSGSW